MTNGGTRGRARLEPVPVVIGLILVALGVLFLLDQAGSLDAGDLIGDWWPVVIIAVGLVQLAERPRSPVGPLIVAGFGAVLLVTQLDLVSREVWNYLWPTLLVIAGLAILFRLPGRNVPAGTSDETLRVSAMFGGNEEVVTSQRLRGGSATAIFGGVVLDLRQVTLDPTLGPGEARLAPTALFGSVEVLVPRGWRVDVSGTPIFGSLANKVDPPGPGEAPTLRVDAVAIFGGVEIKHDK